MTEPPVEPGFEDDPEVVFSRTTYGIEIKTLTAVVPQAQSHFARLIKPGESVVDDLIRDRHEATDPE